MWNPTAYNLKNPARRYGAIGEPQTGSESLGWEIKTEIPVYCP